MNTKISIIAPLFLFTAITCCAQENIQNVFKYNARFQVADLKADHDGNILCAFRADSFATGIPVIMKLDSSFNILWTSELHGGATVNPASFCLMPDNGIAALATTFDTIVGPHGVITRLDDSGNVIWRKITHSNTSEYLSDAVSLPSGNLLVIGGGPADGVIFKLDASGNIVWKKKVEANGFIWTRHITPSNDGNYYITGGIPLNYEYEGLIMKVDSNGNVLWANQFIGSEAGAVSSFAAGNDSAYYFTLDADSPVVVKAYSAGNIPFITSGYHPHSSQTYKAVASDSNGNILVLGTIYDSLQINHGWDLSLTTVSSDGNITNSVLFDAGGNEYAEAMLILNNSLYIASSTVSLDLDSVSIYLIKHKLTSVTNCNAENLSLMQPLVSFLSVSSVVATIDTCSITLAPLSCTNTFISPVVTELCNETGVTVIDSQASLSVFPNPFSEFTELQNSTREKVMLKVFDLNGNLIHIDEMNPLEKISLGEDFQDGLFLVQIISPGSISSMRLVKTK